MSHAHASCTVLRPLQHANRKATSATKTSTTAWPGAMLVKMLVLGFWYLGCWVHSVDLPPPFAQKKDVFCFDHPTVHLPVVGAILPSRVLSRILRRRLVSRDSPRSSLRFTPVILGGTLSKACSVRSGVGVFTPTIPLTLGGFLCGLLWWGRGHSMDTRRGFSAGFSGGVPGDRAGHWARRQGAWLT